MQARIMMPGRANPLRGALRHRALRRMGDALRHVRALRFDFTRAADATRCWMRADLVNGRSVIACAEADDDCAALDGAMLRLVALVRVRCTAARERSDPPPAGHPRVA